MSREIKRVALDFDWPLEKTWDGYLTPGSLRPDPCRDCDETGLSKHASNLQRLWYGYVPFYPESTGSTPFFTTDEIVQEQARRNLLRNPLVRGDDEWAWHREASRLVGIYNSHWCHHLNQADVDALIAEGRLTEFTHARIDGEWQALDPQPSITAKQVNEWSVRALGHDAINRHVVIGARCEREGQPYVCATCQGHGSVEAYEGQQADLDAWEPTQPPTGDGWQVWETVSYGSPISPVFADREALVQWLMTDYHYGHSEPLTRQQAEKFTEVCWAPTLIVNRGASVVPGEQAL